MSPHVWRLIPLGSLHPTPHHPQPFRKDLNTILSYHISGWRRITSLNCLEHWSISLADLFRARPVEFRYADPPKAGFHRASAANLLFHVAGSFHNQILWSLPQGNVSYRVNDVHNPKTDLKVNDVLTLLS